MRHHSVVFATMLALWAPSAGAADAPAPVVVRGTIVSIDAKGIAIAKPDGTTVKASLGPNTAFSTVEPRRVEQIRPADFVGITSVPGPNDTIEAEEIHLIPLKGLNEGSYPWDHHPEGTKPAAKASLTNGTVAVVHDEPPATYTMTNANVTASSGMQLKVTYQGSAMVGGRGVGRAARAGERPCTGVATIDVEPWAPIVAIVPGKSTDAKPGLAVFSTVTTDPQGKPVVLSLVIEKNGVKPQF